MEQALLGDKVFNGFNLILGETLSHSTRGGRVITHQFLKTVVGCPGIACGSLETNEIVGDDIANGLRFVCWYQGFHTGQ